MSRAGPERTIERIRITRAAFILGAVVDGFLFASDLAAGSGHARIPAVAALVLLVLVFLQTRAIRAWRRVQELNRHAGRLELAAKVLAVAVPGSCSHASAESVDLFNPATGERDGERVGWVCPECNADLPAGWTPAKTVLRAEGGTWESVARVVDAGPARLSDMLRETTIATMKPGRPYWTVPWAMRADEEGRLWLDPGYTAYGQRFGTAEMRVERHGDGYHIWPVPGRAYAPESVSSRLAPVAVLEGTTGDVAEVYVPGIAAPVASYALARTDSEIAAARAAAHFESLAKVGLEHCMSYCPICLYRMFGPLPEGWPTTRLRQWLEENWGWKQ